MKLRKPTVGPIVGATTPTRARIWARGDTAIVANQPLRCFGVVRYRKKDGGVKWTVSKPFKMNPNFDMTGVAILTHLEPDTCYDYQVGYYFSDGEFRDATFKTGDWREAWSGSFRTASDDKDKPRTIVVGSCRYLLKTLLGNFYDDRGDKTFRSIVRQLKAGHPINQLLMLGDQIYADDLKWFSPDRTVEDFYARYRDVFGQPWIRKLMSRVPTYMTLDDHEIEDNWPQAARRRDRSTLFPNAIQAYQAYQLSHSPNLAIRKRRLVGTPNHLWYQYSDGCCDIFVTDTRTEREIEPEHSVQIMSQEQMCVLKNWLCDGSGRVKLVVTSVPFFPDLLSSEGRDKWGGFTAQRQELLECIDQNRIQPVVFLSGDVHVSLSAELVSQKALRLYSVISSAFFWPYPTMPSTRHFMDNGDSIDGGAAGQFTVRNRSEVLREDNFTRLKVTPKKLKIDVFCRKGKRLTKPSIVYKF